MTALSTVFTVIPAAEGVKGALAAYRALPRSDKSILVGLHISPTIVFYGLCFETGAAEFVAAPIEAAEEERKAAEEAFRLACEQAGIATSGGAVRGVPSRRRSASQSELPSFSLRVAGE